MSNWNTWCLRQNTFMDKIRVLLSHIYRKSSQNIHCSGWEDKDSSTEGKSLRLNMGPVLSAPPPLFRFSVLATLPFPPDRLPVLGEGIGDPRSLLPDTWGLFLLWCWSVSGDKMKSQGCVSLIFVSPCQGWMSYSLHAEMTNSFDQYDPSNM